MIIITVKRKRINYNFQYKGNIEIYKDDNFITITSNDVKSGNNRILTSDLLVVDKFYLDDVVSIIGN